MIKEGNFYFRGRPGYFFYKTGQKLNHSALPTKCIIKCPTDHSSGAADKARDLSGNCRIWSKNLASDQTIWAIDVSRVIMRKSYANVSASKVVEGHGIQVLGR